MIALIQKKWTFLVQWKLAQTLLQLKAGWSQYSKAKWNLWQLKLTIIILFQGDIEHISSDIFYSHSSSFMLNISVNLISFTPRKALKTVYYFVTWEWLLPQVSHIESETCHGLSRLNSTTWFMMRITNNIVHSIAVPEINLTLWYSIVVCPALNSKHNLDKI